MGKRDETLHLDLFIPAGMAGGGGGGGQALAGGYGIRIENGQIIFDPSIFKDSADTFYSNISADLDLETNEWTITDSSGNVVSNIANSGAWPTLPTTGRVYFTDTQWAHTGIFGGAGTRTAPALQSGDILFIQQAVPSADPSVEFTISSGPTAGTVNGVAYKYYSYSAIAQDSDFANDGNVMRISDTRRSAIRIPMSDVFPEGLVPYDEGHTYGAGDTVVYNLAMHRWDVVSAAQHAILMRQLLALETTPEITQATDLLLSDFQEVSVAHLGEHVRPQTTEPRIITATWETTANDVKNGNGLVGISNPLSGGIMQITWSIQDNSPLAGGGTISRSDVLEYFNQHHEMDIYTGSKVIKGNITSFLTTNIGGNRRYFVNLQDATHTGTFTDGESVSIKLQSNIAARDEFAPVAFSGDYDDLTDKPTIPAAPDEAELDRWRAAFPGPVIARDFVASLTSTENEASTSTNNTAKFGVTDFLAVDKDNEAAYIDSVAAGDWLNPQVGAKEFVAEVAGVEDDPDDSDVRLLWYKTPIWSTGLDQYRQIGTGSGTIRFSRRVSSTYPVGSASISVASASQMYATGITLDDVSSGAWYSLYFGGVNAAGHSFRADAVGSLTARAAGAGVANTWNFGFLDGTTARLCYLGRTSGNELLIGFDSADVDPAPLAVLRLA